MKVFKAILVIVLLISGTNTFAQSILQRETRNLSGFYAVNITGAFNVYLVQGPTESVQIEADKSIFQQVFTDIKKGSLNIYTKDNFSWGAITDTAKKITVYVSVKNLKAISLTGSCKAYFNDGLSGDKLRLELGGSGSISGVTHFQLLESHLNGSGTIHISGQAKLAKVTVVGNGKFEGQGLIAADAQARLGGAGNITINVSGKLKADLTGSGYIDYWGSPQITKSKNGTGDIRPGQ